MNEGYASYAFLVTVCSDDDDLINNFGYKREENFQENIRRKIMKALAGHPHLVSIDVDVVQITAEMIEANAGVLEEEDEDE